MLRGDTAFRDGLLDPLRVEGWPSASFPGAVPAPEEPPGDLAGDPFAAAVHRPQFVGLAVADLYGQTEGGTRGAQMAGTPYWEGSDADPDYAPDGETVVFRRLRRATPDRQGEWDVMVANVDGTGLRPVAEGPAWRGAPDWGPGGIAFVEVDAGQRRLVIVDPGTGMRRVILTAPAGRTLDNPRWIP